uniref:OSJNBa0019J05.24 protein n=1 Tax=Oryza sativa subsp. japonica TaxID=39947 RepID=Q7XW70_ORYSJ|nr:OSJNBa0019J05.24 [Oryza sativa Japonica Group]CAE04074.1 OSJNBb0032D24.4 [Oryza sativa Japonica Group]
MAPRLHSSTEEVWNMKRTNGPVVNLKAFLKKAAAKKRSQEATGPSQPSCIGLSQPSCIGPSQPSCIGPSQPSCIESQIQVVIYQGQPENESDSGASSPTTVPLDVENDDIGGGPNDESSSDEDNDGGVYDIEHDPGLRTPISQYDVNDQDSVRREYIALGPCQPKMKKGDFPQHECGGMRRFLPKWFSEFKWLEYSVRRDAAYCFVCYLFKDSINNHGGDAFVNGGFRNWNIKSRFSKHAGAVNSAHCEAEEKYNLFMQPKTSIRESFASNSAEFKVQYLARLTWSLKCIRYLMRQGLAFRGHDESKDYNNKGNFRELVQWLAGNFEEVNKENTDCAWFFGQLAYLLNVLGMSCKKFHMLCIAQAEYMIEALKLGEIQSGQGLNQEMGLARPGDTRWGSHYKTVMHVMFLYPSIKKFLFKVGKECNGAEAIGAQTMLQVFQSFEFVFSWHMMNEIFETSDFCNALQRREQDIVNAMDLLEFTKAELDVLREDCGWKEFLGKVTSFCVKHKVKVVDMDGKYKPIQRSRKFFKDATNYHRFHADMFLGVIDRQLRCMASFSPAKSFSAFNVDNLVKLAKFYPSDFDVEEMNQLPFQLNRYISDVGKDENFRNLRSLADLSMMLVKTNKVSR